MADTDTWNPNENYALGHEDFFRQYLELPSGIPPHDTIQHSFALVHRWEKTPKMPEIRRMKGTPTW